MAYGEASNPVVMRVFDTAAVEVGPLDLIRVPSVQYILPPATSSAMAMGFPVLVTRSDVAAVEVGPLYPIRGRIRPVHLAAGHVQRDAYWGLQSGGDEGLDAAAVEVGPL